MLLTGTLMIERRQLVRRAFAWATLLGRTSLFVFILQFYLYYMLLLSLNLPYTPLWPLVFAASLVGITVLAKRWDEEARNRHFSVGLRRLTATRVGRLLLVSVGVATTPWIRRADGWRNVR
jgi:hypothetical protein